VAHIRFANHYFHTPYLILGLVEYALLFFTLLAAAIIVYPEDIDQIIALNGLWVLKAYVFAAVMHVSTLAMGVYQAFLREGFVSMAIRTVVAYCLLGGMLYTVLHLLFDPLYLGNALLFISVLLAILMVSLARRIFFYIVDVNQLQRKVVFYGAGVHAVNLLDTLRRDGRRLGVEILGCIPSGKESSVDGAFRLECPRDWLEFARRFSVTEVVVVPDERRRGEGGELPLSELLDCKLAGVNVIEAINFCEREAGKVELGLLHPGWMLFSNGFKYSESRDFAKRMFDILVCSVLIMLAWPLMLITALLVLLETGSPIIYRQIRVGKDGKNFEVLKFRSMRQDAEKDGKAVWATKNDNRVTAVGNFIRNTRLDELPQLWNVLKGEMSFVGPRPERPEFVGDLAEKIPYYNERHRVKPGLMGWAQLNYPYGASEEDAAQKLRYDLYYSKNHSLLLDMLIVIQTAEVILLGKGVH
jgi:sugar transferase (PEP-CTERM system associated)